jgi:hypothetical protein
MRTADMARAIGQPDCPEEVAAGQDFLHLGNFVQDDMHTLAALIITLHCNAG